MNKGSYTAVGIFEAGCDWEITVRVPGFDSFDEARAYANRFNINLIGNQLIRSDRSDEVVVQDCDVSLARMKPETRARINAAHQGYAERGVDNKGAALDSLKAFSQEGTHPLVVTPEDFDPVILPIERWQFEKGLGGRFSCIAWSVDEAR